MLQTGWLGGEGGGGAKQKDIIYIKLIYCVVSPQKRIFFQAQTLAAGFSPGKCFSLKDRLFVKVEQLFSSYSTKRGLGWNLKYMNCLSYSPEKAPAMQKKSRV